MIRLGGLLLLMMLVQTPWAYDFSDIDEDIMPPAPRGEIFQETESDAMNYILEDNDPIEKEIADGHLRHVLVDGDILNEVKNTTGRHKRNSVKERSKLWPGGLVPYIIDGYFNTDSKLAILAAMQRFHERTCVRFRPRTVERDFIHIAPGRGCWSLVGRQGSRQSMSLGATCKTKRGTIMHELMHVLGFRHEHNRPDRDGYVVIYWENISKAMRDNFKKYTYNAVDLLGAQYDFGSIMHYPMYAFSKNGAATLSPRYTIYQEIGYRNDFSDLDVYRINHLYKCGACQDTDPHYCPTWAMSGACTANRHWMAENCAFSCRLCKTNSYGACADHHSSCNAWSKVGECRRNPEWMKQTCPLSCGGCPMDLRNRKDEFTGCHDKNTLCYDWALIGECHVNKGFMSKKCRLSCSFCTDSEIANIGVQTNGHCHDRSTLCYDWWTLGECNKNRGFMNKHCTYSCGTCKANDKQSHPWEYDTKACKNRHPSCSVWAKHGLCKTYSTWMFPNCPYSCKICKNDRNQDLDFLRPTLGSEEIGNRENSTSLVTALPTPSPSDGNWTVSPDIEVQPMYALQQLNVQVIEATEPPMEVLENNDTRDCQDRDGRCALWADEGRCSKPNRFMYDYCRYSCQLCDVDDFQLADVCRDIHGFCSIYAEEGECDGNTEWMNIYCKKSCGLCKRSALTKEPAVLACGDRSTRCTLLVARGDCERARARMQAACSWSCGFCRNTEKDCRDRNTKCQKWAKAGDCDKYTSWMGANCPLSCDTCGALEYDRGCLDEYRKCPSWSAAGECETYPQWMKTNCRYSCDSCDYTITNPGCKDRYKRCQLHAEAGACTNESTVEWMVKHCLRSCNVCDEEAVKMESADGTVATGECQDRSPFCPRWAETNMCQYNPSVMRETCRESCNLCPKIPDCRDKHDSKECKRWAWMGECITNPSGTKPLCKKSCGFCGEREGCRDINRRCIKWARAGECQTTPKFMRKYCAPSCGLCTPSPEELGDNVIDGEQGAQVRKSKKTPAITTQPTTVQPPTTISPAEQQRLRKKNKKRQKKNKKNKKKGVAATRPDSQNDEAVFRTPGSQLPAWKIARLMRKLRAAQAKTRAQEEAKAQRQAARNQTRDSIDEREDRVLLPTAVVFVEQPTTDIEERPTDQPEDNENTDTLETTSTTRV